MSTEPRQTTDPARGSCPECGAEARATDAERWCPDCGLVLTDRPIDHGPEWRPHYEPERDRVGAPRTLTRHDRGLGSTAIGVWSSSNGHGSDQFGSRRWNRLRTQHYRSRFGSKGERNLAYALGQVQRIASRLDLGDGLVEQASQLCRTASEEELFRGRSIDAFAAACVLGVLRVNGLPYGVADVEAYAHVDEASIRSAYDVLQRELGLPARPPTAAAYVPRIATDAGVPDRVERRALELARTADERALVNGCSPAGYAAACCYQAAREDGCDRTRVTQKALANAAGCTAMTVRHSLARVEEVFA